MRAGRPGTCCLPKPYRDGGKPLNSWEIPGLKSVVFVDGTLNDARDSDRAWFVELAFPWTALGDLSRRPSPPNNGDQWRVNFSRVEWPIEINEGVYGKPAGVREDNWVWSPQYVVDMHRPETWGYVQFSTGTSGRVAFAPDRSWPARQWLMQVYYAERDDRRLNGRWANSLAELGVSTVAGATLGNATLTVTGDLFEASIELRLSGAPRERWHVRQDSLIWKAE